MNFINQSYIFHTDNDGGMKGGYQIKQSLKNRSIPNSIIGGSSDEPDLVRFDNLVVPIGLVVTKFNTLLTNSSKNKESCDGYIGDELFDKLFSSAIYTKAKSTKTRKIIVKNTKNKTK